MGGDERRLSRKRSQEAEESWVESCWAWLASLSDVHPPEMVGRGIGGRFERALVKPPKMVLLAGAQVGRVRLENRWANPRCPSGRTRRRNSEKATVVERRHGCRRGEIFEGCEFSPDDGGSTTGTGQHGQQDVFEQSEGLLGTARQRNVVNLESGIGLKDARGRARAQAAAGARNPTSGAAECRDCTLPSQTLETVGDEKRPPRT